MSVTASNCNNPGPQQQGWFSVSWKITWGIFKKMITWKTVIQILSGKILDRTGFCDGNKQTVFVCGKDWMKTKLFKLDLLNTMWFPVWNA